MTRISIDVTEEEHKKLKTIAALHGQSIKDYVLERTIGTDQVSDAALQELEKLIDSRIKAARPSRRSAAEIFAEASGRHKKK